jgi:DNA-binding NarL/FixJ family response regulator
MKPTVVLVEDHIAYRESFRLALQHASEFEVVGQAGSAREGYEVIERQEPDLVVADFMLPDGNGISFARELRRRKFRTKVLILGRISHPIFIRDAMNAGGVGGFALKQESLTDVVEAMKRVLAGEAFISRTLREKIEHMTTASAGIEKLSAREREVLFLLLEGNSSKEIAAALFLSSKTVDAHRLHINRKLNVRSPAALARRLADQGLTA